MVQQGQLLVSNALQLAHGAPAQTARTGLAGCAHSLQGWGTVAFWPFEI